jgi:hypothetical protein
VPVAKQDLQDAAAQSRDSPAARLATRSTCSSSRSTLPRPCNFAEAAAGKPQIRLVERPASRSYQGRRRRRTRAKAALVFAKRRTRRSASRDPPGRKQRPKAATSTRPSTSPQCRSGGDQCRWPFRCQPRRKGPRALATRSAAEAARRRRRPEGPVLAPQRETPRAPAGRPWLVMPGRRSLRARVCCLRHCSFCLKATAMVFDLHPIGRSSVRGHEILPVGGHRISPRAAANSPRGRPRISPPVLS